MAWTLTDLTTAVDLTAECDAATVAVAQRAYAETSRLSFRVNDEAGTISIVTEHEIVLMDGALKAFQGYVRIRNRADTGVSSQRIYEIECQDYTTALGDDLCDSASAVRGVETDKARIAALGAAFGARGLVYSGATIIQLQASMPVADYTGLNMHEVLTEICRYTGGSFYVDFDKVLHYFASEALSAPFGLSDNPNGTTTFGFDSFALKDDSTQYVNGVFVIGTGISDWRPSAAAVATLRAAGTLRAVTIRDPSVTLALQLAAVGDAVLASFGSVRQPASLTTYRPGLRAGMNVQITHSGWGLSAVTYRIASIEARPVDENRFAYQVFFGSNPVSLGGLMRESNQSVAAAYLAAIGAQAAATEILDLSVGGGNLVPNSSFEDTTIWTVGGSWVIGFAAADAFHGAKEARWTPAGSSAALATPFITVDRADAYWASAFIWCRAFTSGRLRMLVEEYNAASTLLATTVVGEVAAVGTKYARLSGKFAPAAGVGITGWQASTAKVRIVFSSQGLASTGTWSVDGVQLERGSLMTAYSPAAYELVDGAITTVDISDDAITAPKIAALQIVAGKIAVGAVGANEIAANAILADKIKAGEINVGHMQGDAHNLVPNPGFEFDPSLTYGAVAPPGWGGGGLAFVSSGGLYSAGFDIAVSASLSHTGARHLRNTQPSPVAAQNADSWPFAVKGGRRYRWRYFVRGSAANNAAARADGRVVEYDADGVFISSTLVASTTVGAGTTWLEQAGTIVLSATTCYVRMRAGTGAVGAVGDLTRWDDWEFIPADQDLDHAGGDVVVDANGVAIDNGALVVTNAGAVVIIDGTSNMFKIAAEMRSPSLGWPAVNATANTTANLGGFGSPLPFCLSVLTRTDTGKTFGERIIDVDAASGAIDSWADVRYDNNAGTLRFVITRGCPNVAPSGNVDFHAFVLKEAAL